MSGVQMASKAVVHDGNGTWFAARSLHVVLLSDAQLRDLESGKESVLCEAFGGATLDVLLPQVVQDPTIEWVWDVERS